MGKNAIRRAIYLIILIGLLAGTGYFSDVFKKDTAVREIPIELIENRLSYTKHARCRMECREISEEDVLETLDNGIWNKDISDMNEEPCPSYVLEHIAKDGQEIRVVFGLCTGVTKVITTIDLGERHECSCD